VGDKWTLLIVRDLASGPRRFVELQRVLPGISTEQLRSRLNRMVADGMLTRKRYREVPPRVDYELTERARDLMPILAELAKWGYEWAWSAPRTTERVDLGAIFRLASGLVSADGMNGEIEMTVTDGGREGGSATYTVIMSGESTEMVERDADRASARITGDTAAWINAFSPDQDRRGLQVTGDTAMADHVVNRLGISGAAAAAAKSAAA
jgi:DNA-binding HxlR family transcriptional regulator